MANETVNDRKERRQIALECAWEIEALAKAIRRDEDDPFAKELVDRTLTIRIGKLACLQMSALDDKTAKVSEMWAVLQEGAENA